LSLDKQNFFPGAFETIFCKYRFVKILAVLGTLKILKILTSLCACSDLYAHAEHMGQERTERTHQEMMRTLTKRTSFSHFSMRVP
jgi:hypothetical protein